MSCRTLTVCYRQVAGAIRERFVRLPFTIYSHLAPCRALAGNLDFHNASSFRAESTSSTPVRTCLPRGQAMRWLPIARLQAIRVVQRRATRLATTRCQCRAVRRALQGRVIIRLRMTSQFSLTERLLRRRAPRSPSLAVWSGRPGGRKIAEGSFLGVWAHAAQ